MLSLGTHRRRYQALETDASSWRTQWREIAEVVRPRSVRWLASDVEQAGQKKGQTLVNNTPFLASRTLAAGLMGGITSPARPWFKLSLPDRGLLESAGVQEWLEDVEREIREAFDRSNFYNALHSAYADLGDFGTACLYEEEDAEDSVRFFHFPVGSYFLAQSDRLACDTLYRRTTLTVRQLVRKFGEASVSPQVAQCFKEGKLEERVEVVHCICPALDAEARREANGKPWLSLWWEAKKPAEGDGAFLRVSGYEERPFFSPRWETTGEDVYGSSPGMAALGDARGLQTLELRKGQLVELLAKPPMTGPASLKNTPISLLPGSFTPDSSPNPTGGFRPAYQVSPQGLPAIAEEIRQHEERIRAAYYADLWLLLSQSEGQMTAREVSERREEKMLQLGTVLQKLKDELLDPAVTRTFSILLRQGRLPPAPEELRGTDVRIEFLSIMAAAQKLQGVTGVERTVVFTQQLSAINPGALDMLDVDAAVEAYADMTGVPTKLLRPAAEVEALRAERAKAAQREAVAGAAQQQADVAKTLADTDTAGNNALTEMLRGVGAR